MLDTKSDTANFSKRLLAYNIDLTVLLVLIFPLSIWIEQDWIFYALGFTIVCLYHAILESSGWQATLGKKYRGMRVVDDRSGDRLSFARAIIRILVKFVLLLICFAGFFMIYFRSDRKGLHDLLARSRVVLR